MLKSHFSIAKVALWVAFDIAHKSANVGKQLAYSIFRLHVQICEKHAKRLPRPFRRQF